MSYFRRGYSWEQIHYLVAPTGGWNPDAPPWELPPNQAPLLDNFLIRPGKIVARGGFDVWADLGVGNAPLNLAGLVMTDTQAIIGRKVVSATAVIDPWNAPIYRPTSSASLAAPSTTLYVISQGGAPSTSIVATNQIPGPRYIAFDGAIYGISYGGAAVQDTQSNYWTVATVLQYYSSLTTTTPTAFTNAPTGALDLRGYLSRIWLLGGVDVPGAGTKFSPNTLFFTNPIVAGGGTASADWKDPVSGLTNKILMDHDTFDPGVALAIARNGLLILRYNSIWILRGTTTQSFSLQPISREAGCVDSRSVVETDHGTYFLSHKGLMVTDGVSVRNVSGPVMNTLQNAVSIYIQNKTKFGGYATCARTSQGHIIVSIGALNIVANAPDGHILPVWCGMYDPTANAWCRLTSPIWALDGTIITTGNNYPGWVFSRAGNNLYTIGDRYITRLEELRNGISFLQKLIPYDKLPSGGTPYAAVPVLWRTKLAPIIGTTTLSRKFGQAKRYFVDHVFATDTNQPANGWIVQPFNADDTAYDGPLQLPVGNNQALNYGSVSGGLELASPSIQRDNQDFVSEIDDLAFQVTWSDTARAAVAGNVKAELFGVGVEYQPSSDHKAR